MTDDYNEEPNKWSYPAFPANPDTHMYSGLTIREYMATKFLAAFLGKPGACDRLKDGISCAIEAADLLLAELDKEK